jgi:hypothetical protein
MPTADKSSPQRNGPEPPSYEEIVEMLTFLVDVIDVKVGESDDRFVRALYTSLQGSLDAALRVEWASRALDDNGDILYID